MKYKKLLVALAMPMLFAACSQEELAIVDNSVKVDLSNRAVVANVGLNLGVDSRLSVQEGAVYAAQWDENGGELTENTERFKKALENLYDILYNGTREFPHNNGVADIEEYVRTADKFFPFGGRTVRAALENSQGYSRETGTVPVSEYPDEADRPEIAEFKDTDGGYTVTYSIKTGRFAQAQLQVKSTFDGYYMFVSNEIVK